MPGSLLHVNATVTCPHAGQATVLPAQQRVLATGQPVATLADSYLVAGCPFVVAAKPQPCLTVRWVTSAGRVMVNGSPALVQSSTGLCLSPEQAPQGAALIAVVQQRVVGQ